MALHRTKSIDLIGVRKEGGTDLVILAGHFDGESETQELLLNKIESYFRFVNGADFRREFGEPSPARTSVVVRYEPGSDPILRELISNAEGWAADNNVSLRLDRAP